jgi:exodeoxyribonuclease V alpha subunit
MSGDAYEAWVGGLLCSRWCRTGWWAPAGRSVRFVEVTVNGPKSWSLAAALHPDVAVAYEAAQDRGSAGQILAWLVRTCDDAGRAGRWQVPVTTWRR